jgi:hypothetical protein
MRERPRWQLEDPGSETSMKHDQAVLLAQHIRSSTRLTVAAHRFAGPSWEVRIRKNPESTRPLRRFTTSAQWWIWYHAHEDDAYLSRVTQRDLL